MFLWYTVYNTQCEFPTKTFQVSNCSFVYHYQQLIVRLSSVREKQQKKPIEYSHVVNSIFRSEILKGTVTSVSSYLVHEKYITRQILILQSYRVYCNTIMLYVYPFTE